MRQSSRHSSEPVGAADSRSERDHIIDDIRGVEPDGFSLTIGLKKYF